MRYIITGGLGFIGSHFTEYILNNYYDSQLIIVDNLYSGVIDNLSKYIQNDNRLQIIKMDIRDSKMEEYILEDDIIIHLAAISSLPECQSYPQQAFDINVSGTINILEIARKKNVKRVIFASTSAVYENNTSFPCKETDSINPNLIYSLTKSTAESICLSYLKNYNVDVRIIRFFNIFGGNQDFRRQSPPLTIYIINELINGRVPILHSDGTQKRDYLYIDDLLNLLNKIIHKETINNRIYNACSGTVYSVSEIYNMILSELKTHSIPIYADNPKYQDPTLFWQKYSNLALGKHCLNKNIIIDEVIKYTLGSNELAKQEFNWYPNNSMLDGLHKIINLKIKNNLNLQT